LQFSQVAIAHEGISPRPKTLQRRNAWCDGCEGAHIERSGSQVECKLHLVTSLYPESPANSSSGSRTGRAQSARQGCKSAIFNACMSRTLSLSSPTWPIHLIPRNQCLLSRVLQIKLGEILSGKAVHERQKRRRC